LDWYAHSHGASIRYERSLNLLQTVAGAIFYARLSQQLPLEYPVQGSSLDLKLLSSIQPLKLKLEILRVISSSIQVFVVRNTCRGLKLKVSVIRQFG
jgi:hypothetical protein